VHWVGDYPNGAFRNENPADRAWAARKIVAFSEQEIRAIVSTGQYTDPRAEEWVARCLIERRRKIVDAFLAGTAGLDGFAVRDNRLEWSYLGGNASAPVVQVQWSTFDNATGMRSALSGFASAQAPDVAAEYLVAELTAAGGPSVTVYIRVKSGRMFVVGIDRSFGAAHVGS
jgi:hypothetical protein